MYAKAAGRDVDKVRGALEEGGVYSFTKFLVPYKPFCAKYMIKLTPWTKMECVQLVPESFHQFVFHLGPLSDLSSRVGTQMYFTGPCCDFFFCRGFPFVLYFTLCLQPFSLIQMS